MGGCAIGSHAHSHSLTVPPHVLVLRPLSTARRPDERAVGSSRKVPHCAPSHAASHTHTLFAHTPLKLQSDSVVQEVMMAVVVGVTLATESASPSTPTEDRFETCCAVIGINTISSAPCEPLVVRARVLEASNVMSTLQRHMVCFIIQTTAAGTLLLYTNHLIYKLPAIEIIKHTPSECSLQPSLSTHEFASELASSSRPKACSCTSCTMHEKKKEKKHEH